MTKIISPIARPATVSVTQLDGEPTSGRAAMASAGISSSGIQSRFIGGVARWIGGMTTVTASEARHSGEG